ncbi:MAG: hypothetical protein KDD66_04480 [Bdellovibrionales bacterium]|nr:hypothetical protein [Bdellovibrionales bacterium]
MSNRPRLRASLLSACLLSFSVDVALPLEARADSAFETLHQNLGTLGGLTKTAKSTKPIGPYSLGTDQLNSDEGINTYSDDDSDAGNDPVPYPDIPVKDNPNPKVDPKDDIEGDRDSGKGGAQKDTTTNDKNRPENLGGGVPDVYVEGNGGIPSGMPTPGH